MRTPHAGGQAYPLHGLLRAQVIACLDLDADVPTLQVLATAHSVAESIEHPPAYDIPSCKPGQLANGLCPDFDANNLSRPWHFRAALFGCTPHTYFAHHVLLHHPTNNLADDPSSTMGYRRDNARDFARYWARFFFSVAALRVALRARYPRRPDIAGAAPWK